MNKDEQLKLLKDLTEAKGISGDEKEVSRVVKNYLQGYVDEFDYDNLGSIIAIKKGQQDLKLMFSGHIDEVGFIVSHIEENGFLRMNPVGGWWGHVVPAHKVSVKTMDDKVYYGIIGSIPPHGMKQDVRNKVMEIKDMYVDLGVKDKKEVLDLGINVGDSIIPYTEFMVMNNPDYVCSKAFDDRIGAAVIVEVLSNLKGKKTAASIYGVGSVQEEVGLRGARTAAYKINPDIAIAIDVTLSHDVPNVQKTDCKLGNGIALSLMDSSVIANRGLFKILRNICQEKNIPFTYDCMSAGGTDSGEISKSRDGVINMTLSLPCRYFHSHYSIVSLTDYNACVDLLTEFALRLDSNMLEEIKNSKK